MHFDEAFDSVPPRSDMNNKLELNRPGFNGDCLRSTD